MAEENEMEKDSSDMTVSEAGHKGGQRVRELVEEGKESEGMTPTSERDEEDVNS
jgi:hypothetical protein